MHRIASWLLGSLLGLAALLSLVERGAAAEQDEPAKKNPKDGARPGDSSKKIPWTASRVVGTPDPPSRYEVERMFGQLSFKTPVDLVLGPEAGPDGKRLFVVELEGKIFSFANAPDGPPPEPALFFDIRALHPTMKMAYGLAFHPDFAKNRYCYLCYVFDEGRPDGSRVSRFEVDAGEPPRIKPESEQIVLTFLSGGHNGGCLKFGPDGCLYISTGDGTPPFPPDRLRTGQDIGDLLSSILRIDVDHPGAGKPYSIPPDNPFVELAGVRGEVWAYGFRNPWKMSFDAATGELWTGDVGWELLEMVYRVERGGNYGWAAMEGSQPVLAEEKRGPTPILPPVVEHSHTEARSITGGYVYHGRRLPELANRYIYGDFETGKIWALGVDGRQSAKPEELVDTSLKIISFATDSDGELYVLDHQGGLYRLVPNPRREANQEFPRRLSETGLFSATDSLAPAPGVVRYRVAAEPWADQAVAERHLGLTGESQIEAVGGALRFPAGAVLAKTISLALDREAPQAATRLETQLLHFDGRDWRGYSYAWNEAQTDAELVGAEGMDRTLLVHDPEAPGGRRRQAWRFASRAQCVICHNTMAGSVLGFTPVQLNVNQMDDGGSGATDTPGNQLLALAEAKFLSGSLPDTLPKLVDPGEASAEIGCRARSYLHANCSHCHRRHGGGTAAIELPYELSLEDTHAIDVRPTQGTFDIHGAKVISPGDPYRSVLFYRMAKLGRGRMPHLGSSLVDEAGLKLVHDWIAQLPAAADSGAEAPRGDATRDVAAALAALRASKTPPDDAEAALAQLLTSPRGALALANAIGEKSLREAVRTFAIAKGVQHRDAQISGLFERFVPEDKRPQRLGDAIRAEQIASLAGEAAAGRRLFFEAAAVQCKNCHRIEGQGLEIGPDLSQIGKKYNRAQLLETILQPSKQIDPKYVAYLVETADGQVHTGLLIERTEQELVLRDSQNKLIRIPTAEAELVAPQQKSLMPELLLRDMTAQEAADLLEFLGTLKGP
ncbi:MAG TPA: PQQ-dependent sugar dehydrogenase [Pirellulales bacterium]|nr:PQQ-dependent sugar dehydrogenase [Pirellulales bacterium]